MDEKYPSLDGRQYCEEAITADETAERRILVVVES
jgi:hypothetical protein